MKLHLNGARVRSKIFEGVTDVLCLCLAWEVGALGGGSANEANKQSSKLGLHGGFRLERKSQRAMENKRVPLYWLRGGAASFDKLLFKLEY